MTQNDIKELLRITADILIQRTSDRMMEGAIPKAIPIQGLLALMHDKILRYLRDERFDKDELLDLAVDAFVALYKETEQAYVRQTQELNKLPQEESIEIEPNETADGEELTEEDAKRWTPKIKK